MHGTFVWNELAATDVDKAKAFYAETFGWEYEEFQLPNGIYWVARSNGELVGGIGDINTVAGYGTNTSTWFSFIEVDNVDARLEKALSLGAEIIQPAENVPNVGRVAILRDPARATIGLMTSIKDASE